jgi:hypothetical protein
MFKAGDELIFAIYVTNTGYWYYSGDADRNPDGVVHAAVTDLGDGDYHIGFEDLYGGGDEDYDDINFILQTKGIYIDEDADDDGIVDGEDNCPTDYNPEQGDADGDGLGDACDGCAKDPDNDKDRDGFCADVDNCPTTANKDQADSDDDGNGDECDICPKDPDDDIDADDVCGDVDNCVEDYNPKQENEDDDVAGDACDTCPYDADDDADGDGVCGDVDQCAGTTFPDDVPTEYLGVNRFADTDGDGKFDTVSPKGKGPGRYYTIEDTAGCSCSQIIDALDLGEGHSMYGCSISAMDDWKAIVSTGS